MARILALCVLLAAIAALIIFGLFGGRIVGGESQSDDVSALRDWATEYTRWAEGVHGDLGSRVTELEAEMVQMEQRLAQAESTMLKIGIGGRSAAEEAVSDYVKRNQDSLEEPFRISKPPESLEEAQKQGSEKARVVNQSIEDTFRNFPELKNDGDMKDMGRSMDEVIRDPSRITHDWVATQSKANEERRQRIEEERQRIEAELARAIDSYRSQGCTPHDERSLCSELQRSIDEYRRQLRNLDAKSASVDLFEQFLNAARILVAIACLNAGNVSCAIAMLSSLSSGKGKGKGKGEGKGKREPPPSPPRPVQVGDSGPGPVRMQNEVSGTCDRTKELCADVRLKPGEPGTLELLVGNQYQTLVSDLTPELVEIALSSTTRNLKWRNPDDVKLIAFHFQDFDNKCLDVFVMVNSMEDRKFRTIENVRKQNCQD